MGGDEEEIFRERSSLLFFLGACSEPEAKKIAKVLGKIRQMMRLKKRVSETSAKSDKQELETQKINGHNQRKE